jgi:hypothetical protein
MHEGHPHEAEHRFNWEMYSPSPGAVWMLLHINGKCTTRKFKSLLLNRFRSMYEVDLAALDTFLSSSSGGQRQSTYSINLELFNDKIPSILLN